MAAIDIEDLTALVEKGRELKTLLQESPEILRFAEYAAQGNREAPALVTIAKTDVLIRAHTAAEILCVSKSAIYDFERRGLLQAYYTPGSSHKKYWLSKVKAIAKQEGEKSK